VLTHIPFDRWTTEIPYEERTVQDENLWKSFPDRVAEATADWPFPSFLARYWDAVNRRADRSQLLGERLASGRRSIERVWGCHNLELPVSTLCRTDPFAWFAAHVLAHLPSFHAVYNASVHDYRKQYGIRSRNHPVPDLGVDGDWLEAPLWGWRAGQDLRGRLFSRRCGDVIELRAGAMETWPSLPASNSDEHLIQEYLGLQKAGYKIRSRALTNTLFARLFIGDLFIHGIGGGKYDELTDAIIRGFYRMEPPAYLVLSGTLQLPFASEQATPLEVKQQAKQLRDLYWNPQRHLMANGKELSHFTQLAQRKQDLIELTPPEPRDRRQRFIELRHLTTALRPAVQGQIRDGTSTFHALERSLTTRAILHRRDYPFCVYPETELREFFAQARC
jgi:hypothetical protein